MKTEMNQIHPLRNLRTMVARMRNLIERQHTSFVAQQPRLLRRALTEAEALAWETGFPHLIFPTLALEKIESFAEWRGQPSTSQGEERLALAA